MEIFTYGETEIAALSAKCLKMKALIDEAGMLRRRVEPDLFKALISSIVSQQISTKAAATVFTRLESLVVTLTANNILAKTDAEIKACGLSYKKVGYLKGICEAISSGALVLDELIHLSDDEVVAELIKLNGIGVWSAEMFLIFSLKRPDILSFGDLIIRKGIMTLHGLDNLTKQEFAEYKKRYSPYGTVASLYLWNLAHQK